MAQLDKIRLSGTTYDLIDATAIHSLDGYYTSGETNAAITAATNALAESIAEQNYQTSGDVQNAISEATSGKVDTSTYTAYTASTDAAIAGKADISDIPSVTSYADSVQYNSTSKYVEFYHGGTGGTKVFEFNAAPFLIDGMVQNVEIKDVTISGESVTCLVISFNTDAGKQDINIPIADIFDASNYYTKSQVDSALSDKADYSAATITTQETGTVTTAITEQVISVPFNYDDGVYYLSGYSFHWEDTYITNLNFTISDGTNSITLRRINTGDTSDYTFTTTVSSFILQTKGSYKIVAMSGFADEGPHQISYKYTYSKSGETAVSTYIEDEINPALSSKVDTTTYTAYTADTATALASKQATLVSGTNIKTVNGNSLLGSGDLTIQGGLQAEVSGTTLIFS